MSELLVVAGDNPAVAQLWIVEYPGGAARPVTNDLNQYRAIGLTQDGKKLSTVQAHGLVNLWVAAEGKAANAVRLPTGNVSFYSSTGNNIAWTRDGRLVFVTTEGGNADIWLADPDGGNRKQLTANGANNFSPVVSVDGRYIVFVSWRDGKRNLWRMASDGSNPIRLTSGIADSLPSLTPDSRWIVYTAFDGAKPTLWKVSIDGGTPVQISDHVATGGAVSPDGRSLAYTYPESPDPLAPPNRIAIMPFDGGPNTKTFDLSPTSTVLTLLQWAPDGKSLLYTINSNNVSNIWSQPVDGGPLKQVTDFKDMLMTGFAWSQDGKQLACTRGTLLRDAILISDLK
jgi:Tol biopolymer transport system component